MSWLELWRSVLHLPEATPAFLVAMFALMFLLFIVVVPFSALVGFLDRKLVADLQARVGPNRVGAAGALQPVADLLKLLQKPALYSSSRPSELGLLLTFFAILLSTLALLPLSSRGILLDTDFSVLVPLWACVAASVVAILLGEDQGVPSARLAGLRVWVQTISGVFPALLCLLAVGVETGGFRWSTILEKQGASPLSWNFVYSPFAFLAFSVFAFSGVVLTGAHPWASLEGLAPRLGGARYTLFSFSRFYLRFMWQALTVALFLGGPKLPAILIEPLLHGGWSGAVFFLELAYMLIKILVFGSIIRLLVTVTPSVRTEQVTDLCWKVLTPAGLIALVGSALWGWGVGG
jgi:NADH-quinone oxidoreductase subunit H